MAQEKLRVEFEVDRVDDNWKEYGISEKYLTYDGEKTRFKGIVQDGRLVNLVSNRYTVIPNELIIEGAVPLIEQFGYESIDSPAKDVKNTRYMQYFIKPDLERIDNETIKLGLLLRNSIDGSMSLGIEGFIYRTVCSNGVVMGRETIYGFSKKHVGNAKDILSYVEKALVTINKSSLRILEKYNHLLRATFKQEKYENLEKHLPKKDLVDVSRRVGGSDWNAFNSVTQNIWHNKSAGMINQHGKMKIVNRVFGI